MRIELDYEIDPACGGIENPNFAVSVHMFGAGLYYQFQSRRDGVDLGRCVGSGTVAVDLPGLSLGEGIYQIGVALADEKGLPEHDWHDRAYRINVVSDGATDGPVYQPRRWVKSVEPPMNADERGWEEEEHCSTAVAHCDEQGG
jgi:hypothetical protein